MFAGRTKAFGGPHAAVFETPVVSKSLSCYTDYNLCLPLSSCCSVTTATAATTCTVSYRKSRNRRKVLGAANFASKHSIPKSSSSLYFTEQDERYQNLAAFSCSKLWREKLLQLCISIQLTDLICLKKIIHYCHSILSSFFPCMAFSDCQIWNCESFHSCQTFFNLIPTLPNISYLILSSKVLRLLPLHY